MSGGFVVVCQNSDNAIAVFGTTTERVFTTLPSATRAQKRYEKRHPTVSTVVVFVDAEEPAEDPEPAA